MEARLAGSAVIFFANLLKGAGLRWRFYGTIGVRHRVTNRLAVKRNSAAVKNVISMNEHLSKAGSLLVRDRRYAIRHPFAADAEFLDLEAGTTASGVTSDVSLGGCFVCTSKPFPLGSRVRLRLTRKEQMVEALAVVRIVKPRIGMGLEFLDIEVKHHATLERWLEQVRRTRT
jgi:hypothetical protein